MRAASVGRLAVDAQLLTVGVLDGSFEAVVERAAELEQHAGDAAAGDGERDLPSG